jgi:hypothetical protein
MWHILVLRKANLLYDGANICMIVDRELVHQMQFYIQGLGSSKCLVRSLNCNATTTDSGGQDSQKKE